MEPMSRRRQVDTQAENRILAKALFEYVDAGAGVTITRDGVRITFEVDELEVLEEIVNESKANPEELMSEQPAR
jgi:uncharacterized protein (UPF0216 family)